MSELLNQGLLITAIGMGLVFLALILLWGLMAFMASIKVKEKSEAVEVPAAEETEVEPQPEANGNRALFVRAAAAAVATAMLLARRSPKAARPAGSSWQTSKRTSQMSSNQSISYRKPRGSVR
ncbi:MAG: OadG family protein [Bellilinea sp.]